MQPAGKKASVPVEAADSPERKQPMFIKKKNGKSLQMQKQLSSTLEINMAEAEEVNDAMASNVVPDANKLASAQMPKGKDPFE